MIIKGASRAGPSQLARHLLRADTNERVEILELQSPTGDLTEALRDWQVLAGGTRGSKGLYHANIDPAKDYEMTPEQWERAVAVLEEELGFEGQPRAVVMHGKHGREHVHVVWQRTDVDSMTLRSDSWNYLAHEKASQRLELEFGHEHVPGKHAKRDREKQPEFPKSEITHAEWQQKERTGIDPRERREHITELFQHSDTGKAFKNSLEADGYILAQGDRRDFVLVDALGEIYGLSRQIKHIKASDLREFMSDVDRENLPDVAAARALQDERERERAAQTTELAPAKEQAATPEPSPELPPAALTEEEQKRFSLLLAERHADDIRKLQVTQEAEVRQTQYVLDTEIREKMQNLDAMQKAERDQVQRERQAQRSVLDDIDRHLRPERAAEREAQRQKSWDDLIARQKSDRQEYHATLRQSRNKDIDGLIERQAHMVRDERARHDAERERYRRDQEAARRLLEELEAARQRQEQLARSRDGPEGPPGRAR